MTNRTYNGRQTNEAAAPYHNRRPHVYARHSLMDEGVEYPIFVINAIAMSSSINGGGKTLKGEKRRFA